MYNVFFSSNHVPEHPDPQVLCGTDGDILPYIGPYSGEYLEIISRCLMDYLKMHGGVSVRLHMHIQRIKIRFHHINSTPIFYAEF